MAVEVRKHTYGRNYTVALYMRLSKEDDRDRESNSIANQRSLLYQYLQQRKEFDGCRIMELSDDGYTGKKFDRPQFLQLIEMLEEKRVDCVIVKDFSRFGRDYIEVGNYLEQIFPLLGVRFISVNDNYDSAINKFETGSLDVVFKNFMNDFYSRDTSKKIKCAKRALAERGEYFAPFAPYGYMKSSTDKHKLIPDPETADIVKRIFGMRIAGNSISQIARKLNSENILCPSAYILQKNPRLNYTKWKKNVSWSLDTVSRILSDEKYIGNMVFMKRSSKEIYGKTQNTSSEDWVRKKNTHEPIISKEDFLLVQNMRRKVSSRYSKGQCSIFYCGHCGRKLARAKENRYYCKSGNVNPNLPCYQKKYDRETIKEAIWRCLQWHFKQFLDCSKLQQTMLDKMAKEQKLADNYEQELKRIESLKVDLYENYRCRNLSRESFMRQKETYDKQEKKYEDFISSIKLKKQTNEYQKQILAAINKYKDADCMTDEIEKAFIEKVMVFPDGSIQIGWKFKDVFPEQTAYI